MLKTMLRAACAFTLAAAPLAVGVSFAPPVARAQEAVFAPGIALSGKGVAVSQLTPASLSDLPMVSREVTFQSSEGQKTATFEGVLLWDVLKRAKLMEGIERHAELLQTFEVKGRDGYAIAFSVGEIEPDFGATPAMIALKVDGRALDASALRLVVPGDTRGARNVRDVASITLR